MHKHPAKLISLLAGVHLLFMGEYKIFNFFLIYFLFVIIIFE